MPWVIKRLDGKYKVVQKDSGRVAGTHNTRAEAQAQLRALYANVKEK